MKVLFLSHILLTLISSAHAMSVSEAFQRFYDNGQISPYHCGKNIHHFLKYLKNKNIEYKSGFVVSVHEDFASLNHFDARWGSKETYQNGENYSRSNWYFHVFAVIDGRAYDFSQASKQPFLLKKYLESSYYPSDTTENILMQGRLTREKVRKKYLNMKMNIYPLENYRKKMGPTLYSGSFTELFKHAQKNPLTSDGFHNKNIIRFNTKKINNDKSIRFTGLNAIGEKGEYPIKAESVALCRALGFFGSLASKTTHVVSDNKKMYKIYSNLTESPNREIRSSQISISLSDNLARTLGSVPNQPLLHYAKEVTCSDLHSVIKALPLEN